MKTSLDSPGKENNNKQGVVNWKTADDTDDQTPNINMYM